jgi:hypothetical protein
MLIYLKKKKNFLRTDGQTDGQPKTIVRNLTIRNQRNYFSQFLCSNLKILPYYRGTN